MVCILMTCQIYILLFCVFKWILVRKEKLMPRIRFLLVYERLYMLQNVVKSGLQKSRDKIDEKQ